MTATVIANNPLRVGLQSARANLLPGLIVQSAMAVIVAAYYLYAPAHGWLELVAAAKSRYGFGFSAGGAAIAGAFVPELLRIACFQQGKPRVENARNLVFTIPFWAFNGFMVDLLYRGQALCFGTAVTPMVIVKKVLVDQFIYNVIYAAPITAIGYHWKNEGYSWTHARSWFTRAYYAERILPALVATWGVWIPLVSLIYALPPLLQTPLFTLALSLWVMIYTWMAEQHSQR